MNSSWTQRAGVAAVTNHRTLTTMVSSVTMLDHHHWTFLLNVASQSTIRVNCGRRTKCCILQEEARLEAENAQQSQRMELEPMSKALIPRQLQPARKRGSAAIGARRTKQLTASNRLAVRSCPPVCKCLLKLKAAMSIIPDTPQIVQRNSQAACTLINNNAELTGVTSA